MSVSIVNLTLDEVEVLGITEFSSISKSSGKIEQFKYRNNRYSVWYPNNNTWISEYPRCSVERHILPNSIFTVHYEED